MFNGIEIPKPLTQEEFEEIQKVDGSVYYPSFVGNNWHDGAYARKITMGRYPVIYKTEAEAKKASELIRESMRGDRNKSSFDDLIGIAVKAVKDGVIAAIEFHNDLLVIFVGKSAYIHATPSFTASKSTNVSYISEVISKIDSLYVESFEIESEEDIGRIIGGAKITLSNGNEVTADSGVKVGGTHKVWLDKYSKPVGLFFLKGATVTQKKVNN